MQPDTKFLGIEIGGTKLQLTKGDSTGSIERKVRYRINNTGGAASIQEQIKAGLTEIDPTDVAAIGVGFGGPVDWESGTIKVSHQVKGWSDFNLVQWLRDLTGKAVAIENDANVAALAEAVHGSGKEHKRVFYMTIGSGIGGGFIINGKIYHGRSPGEVEVGHLRLNKAGETLEDKCSGWAVNKKIRTVIEQEPGSLLAQLAQASNEPEATLLAPALKKEDLLAREIIEDVSDDLAFALSHVVHLFHPDLLVIGGGLSLLEDALLTPIQAKLPQYIMQAFLPPPEIKTASLGENVVPIGALEIAKRAFQKSHFQTTSNSL